MSRLVPSALELIPPCLPGPPYKKPRYGPVAIREVSVKTPWNQRGNFCFVSFSFKFPKTTRARPAGHEFSAGHVRVKNRVAQPPLTPSPTEPHRSIDHLVPGPTRRRPFSVPTHSRWRAVRNLRKKMKFYCKISAEPSPQNLLLCSMLMLSSYRPSPCVSLSLQHFISALK